MAVYGRRRVGKTQLVREVFGNQFTFQMTAIANVTKTQQLLNFYTTLQEYQHEKPLKTIPTNWFLAFRQLIDINKL